MTESQPQMTLYRGWLEHGKHVWSPFVVKLEARFRFAGLKYTTDAGNPTTAPKGKIPYVEIRQTPDAELSRFGDSTLIIKGLMGEGLLPDLNAQLEPTAKAQDLALRALMEDKLYFYHTQERWVEHYYTMRDHALWSVPYPLRVLVGLIVLRGIRATMHGQGTGRFTHDEIRAFKIEIWDDMAGLLSVSKARSTSNDEPFWALGLDHPTEADTSIFGCIVSVLMSTASPESTDIVKSRPVLVEYARRIHEKFFPDYEMWS